MKHFYFQQTEETTANVVKRKIVGYGLHIASDFARFANGIFGRSSRLRRRRRAAATGSKKRIVPFVWQWLDRQNAVYPDRKNWRTRQSVRISFRRDPRSTYLFESRNPNSVVGVNCMESRRMGVRRNELRKKKIAQFALWVIY